jgi:hypothetical protein
MKMKTKKTKKKWRECEEKILNVEWEKWFMISELEKIEPTNTLWI